MNYCFFYYKYGLVFPLKTEYTKDILKINVHIIDGSNRIMPADYFYYIANELK